MSEVTPTYSGIDSGKTVNKEGLLELCAKIKEAIAALALPSSQSSDGTYVLAETISSGTASRSWQTMPSGGGGTTYIAGTGISISNGVISLALANASQEAM